MTKSEKEFRALEYMDIVGEFKNKHGEVFVLYRIWGVVRDYVTGDELGWETGWFRDGSYTLAKEFILTSPEADGLDELSERKRNK